MIPKMNKNPKHDVELYNFICSTLHRQLSTLIQTADPLGPTQGPIQK